MTKREGRLCRFCLSVVSNENFNEIENNIKEMLEVLQLKLNFHISEELVCSKCMGSVQDCLNFKSSYLKVEDFIIDVYNSEGKSKLDLREVYMRKNKHSTTDIVKDQEICRLCIKLSRSSSCKPLIKVREDMIQKCIPELNSNLTNEPVICDCCLNSLKCYFHFLKICAGTEENIIANCKEATSCDGPKNVNNVVQNAKNISEFEKDIAKVNVVYLDELHCENNESKIIDNKAIIEKEYVKNNIKTSVQNIEVDIKQESLLLHSGELEMVKDQNELQTGVSVEETIMRYCKLEGIEYEEDSTKVIDLGGLCCETIETNIKTEAIHERDREFEDIENYIKTDVDENIVKMEIKAECLELEDVKLEIMNEQNELQTEQSNFERSQNATTTSQTNTKNINTSVYKYGSCCHAAKRKGYLKQHLLTHPKELSETVVYNCDQCSFKTKYKRSLKKHLWNHRGLTSVTEYKCEQCTFKTKYKHSITRHKLTHQDISEVTVYRCDTCTYVTKRKSNLINHMPVHASSENEVYNCDQCQFKTRHKKSLKTHMVTHQELSEVKVYNCEQCSFQTKYRKSLTTHMLTHRELSEVKSYKCDSCSYVTKYKHYLKTHISYHRKRSEVVEYKCGSCSYTTNHKGSLTRHMLVHKESSEAKCMSDPKDHNVMHGDSSKIIEYYCAQCSFKTKYKKSLRRHVLTHRDPAEVNVFKCERCSFVTKYKGHLKIHSLIHRELSEVVTYKCENCSYVTKQKKHLARHLLTHRESSEVSAYQCEICQYDAKYKSHLESHMVMHRDLSKMVYNCEQCSYKTRYKYCLKRHMSIHLTEVKMYTCENCIYVTKRKGDLNAHMMKVHQSSRVASADAVLT